MSRVLVLLLDDVGREELEAALEPAAGDEPAGGGDESSVYIVVPSRVGPLEWLATDEARAHGEAASRVLGAEWLLAGSVALGGEAGEADPLLAVRDALERFPADEIVVVGRRMLDPGFVAGLERFGLPLRLRGVALGPPSVRGRLRELASGFSSGRSQATPFVALIAANLGLLAIVVVGSLFVALVVWLIDNA